MSHIATVITAAFEMRQLQCNIASLKEVQYTEIFDPGKNTNIHYI